MNNEPETGLTACEEFQQRLSALAQSGEVLYRDPHLQTCQNCRALVVDLEIISESARDVFGSAD